MAKRKSTTRKKAKRNQKHALKGRRPRRKTPPVTTERRYCSQPIVPEPVFAAGMNPYRLRDILMMRHKWTNFTKIRYYFFDRASDRSLLRFSDGSQRHRTWVGSKAQEDAVRAGFEIWKSVGIGLEFEEVSSREEADVRIGFLQDNRSWSYLGRQVLNITDKNERTMNFGWDITGDDTAIHEIGHTLGLPHEHQNPNAGIIWDEEAVYADFGSPPNNWDRETTFHNIIRKIPADDVQGSSWDANSIMHYSFKAGLIKRPTKYRTENLSPSPGLSTRDETWVKSFYPGGDSVPTDRLIPMVSVPMHVRSGEQKDFLIEPDTTRYYEIQTFGTSDTVMVLSQDVGGDVRYVTADDDSGQDHNARLRVKLFRGDRYLLRIRLYWTKATGDTAVMMY